MKKHNYLTALLIFLSFSCTQENAVDACLNFIWGYEDNEQGPDHWRNCFFYCNGANQSPINITGVISDTTLPLLEIEYESVPINIVNNGRTLEFEYEKGSRIKLDDDYYNLIQFHFHTESEHTLENKRFPMEAHLVHRSELTGLLVVIGILFEENNQNDFLEHFSSNLPLNADQYFTSEDLVNIEDLLPNYFEYYTYQGSLTTPPCSQIATWILLKNTVEASEDQIRNIRNIIGNNYRPVQPLNGRIIKTLSF